MCYLNASLNFLIYFLAIFLLLHNCFGHKVQNVLLETAKGKVDRHKALNYVVQKKKPQTMIMPSRHHSELRSSERIDCFSSFLVKFIGSKRPLT